MRLVRIAGLMAAAISMATSANADVIGLSTVMFSDTPAESCASLAALCNFLHTSSGAGLTATGQLFDVPNLSSPLNLGTITIGQRGGLTAADFLDLKVTFAQSDGTTVDVYFTGDPDGHSGTVTFGSKTFQFNGERLRLDIAAITNLPVSTPGDPWGLKGNQKFSVRFDANPQAAEPASGPIIGTLVELTPGVPEPSTWTMMVLGFCALGILFSRQSKRAVPRLT
ncbi:PEP-CTERM sorting domain-containing protein [Bradyrhizobium sp. INPA01-394B]|uniref:PEP-CTERM sorting domain-containing protein n=1 Tax=Bradyrhizobium campsiandrae TaxID=1729892 RepID=A0ABR7UJX5_9BRAD|nr:PEP-CTERM sorting domain-containing protein [Bradyrhizobium campsiandrae]MBC9882907.1 PEP-CTERM sorting domain-containing protein [Bradyrhizobium campsiandrae]MBC9984414.1 PEP-CTERM sorting domain-containing protein [Bradyrhizobium campsiandrae]